MISNEEWHTWKYSDTGKVFFSLLRKKREEMKENLINNKYEDEEFVKGKAMVLYELLNLDYESLLEEINDS
jgi:hypothetical protein